LLKIKAELVKSPLPNICLVGDSWPSPSLSERGTLWGILWDFKIRKSRWKIFNATTAKPKPQHEFLDIKCPSLKSGPAWRSLDFARRGRLEAGPAGYTHSRSFLIHAISISLLAFFLGILALAAFLFVGATFVASDVC